MKIVEAVNLQKFYGETCAVDGLSFDARSGEILALIGPNGAGKSSTIKMILEFIKPDDGKISVFGSDLTESMKNNIGYLPEEKGLYRKLQALELIHYFASLKGMDKKSAKARAEELLKQTNLFDSRHKKIKEMSRGMGQMIQFIITIIHNPDLVILDEPFSGLDPVNTDLMKKLIVKLRDEGKCIILCTHQMNQVEELCDRILMVYKGKAVFYGDLKNEIRERYRLHAVRVDIEGEMVELDGVKEIRQNRDYTELLLEQDYSAQAILDQLRDKGIAINKFEIAHPSLNDIFLEIVGVHHV